MRVLVTGHNGYIGSVLVPMLQDAGHEVLGLDLDLFAPCVFGDRVADGGTVHEGGTFLAADLQTRLPVPKESVEASRRRDA